ncbi:hypothetical protein CR513_41971, partial [Mucuna pruriens]
MEKYTYKDMQEWINKLKKKKNVQKLLTKANIVTTFINNIFDGKPQKNKVEKLFTLVLLDLLQNPCSLKELCNKSKKSKSGRKKHLYIVNFEPMVKVLKLFDEPKINFIYEIIDRAKQAIQQYSHYYSKYNEIIDKRWLFMHSVLHFARILIP